MSTRARDPYEVLGVPRNATQEEIRTAYRKLARAHHPDVSREPDAEERFKQIAEANDVLGDPETRARFDRFGPAWREMGGQGRPPPSGNGGAGPDVRVVYGDAGDMGGIFGERGFGDLFGDLFRRSGGPPQDQRTDLGTEVDVSPDEAALGATVEVTTPTGVARVKVPPGSSSGRRLRLRGKGHNGGDLYATLRIVVPKNLTDDEREAYERLRAVSGFRPRARA
jgi:curved DNA-binding protein